MWYDEYRTVMHRNEEERNVVVEWKKRNSGGKVSYIARKRKKERNKHTR